MIIGIPHPCIMVPYERNEFFVGRKTFIKQIFDRFCDSAPRPYRRRIALFGMGGVGKTQIALAYVCDKKAYYDFVFWISGVNHAAILSGYQDIASKTGCSPELSESNLSETIKRVLDWLQRHGKWLLVIDNVDDVTVIKGLLQ